MTQSDNEEISSGKQIHNAAKADTSQGQPWLIHLVSSNRWGGMQRYACDICAHYKLQGWRVSAVTREARVVDDRFRDAGIELLHAPLHGFFDPVSALMLARELREAPHNRTYVHVHRYRDAFTVLLAKRIAARPDVRVFSTRHTVRQGRNSWLFRRIYNKINGHIFVSQTAFDRFKLPWPDKLPMEMKTVHILHNSVNMRQASPMPEPSKGPIIAAYAGAVVKGKGIETIIDALALLRDVKIRLRICGKGNPDYRDQLRRRAIARNVMERIDWKQNSESPYESISGAHFVVLPSVDREAFGMSNIDAMAAARPQICCPTGAQPEYLEDGRTAIFVPPADASALTSAMQKLASDKSLREQMGRDAYDYYTKHLSWESFIPQLTAIYLNS